MIPIGFDIWMRGKTDKQLLSFNKTGTAQGGFYVSGLGALPMPVTITGWFKFGDRPSSALTNCDRIILKYGYDDGFGIGIYIYDSSRLAYLNELKWWQCINSSPSQNWKHLAILGKTSAYPHLNSVFINGTKISIYDSILSHEVTPPTTQFSLCGRISDQYNIPISVSRPTIFSGLLSQDEIIADMNLGKKPNPAGNVIHFWSGETNADGKAIDSVGSWHLTPSAGCSITTDTPWSDNGGGITENA